MSNVLSNAIRHTPQSGTIRLRLEKRKGHVLLSTADTGTGLSEGALKHVFDRFYRSDKGRVRSEGGAGLGLAIVKALVELHGGSISAKNHVEGGAVFTILLPNAASSHSVHTPTNN